MNVFPLVAGWGILPRVLVWMLAAWSLVESVAAAIIVRLVYGAGSGSRTCESGKRGAQH